MILRAVLDTNVLVSGFASPGGTPAQLLDRWLQGEFVLLVSQVIIADLDRTLRNEYFGRIFHPEMVQANVELLHQEAESIIITKAVSGVASHPEDDLILATAVSGGADYLVTGDRDLLALEAFQAIQILTPRAFLDIHAGADSI